MAEDETDQNSARRVFDPDDDETLSHSEHMVAGAAAGLAEHCVMHPVDTVKTRMQVYSGGIEYGNQSFLRALRSIVRREGALRLWRGIGPVLMSAGPAHAVQFAVYESIKSRMIERNAPGPLANGFAGGLALVASEGLSSPMDVVKQRMQISRLGKTMSTLESIRRIYADHGLSAFFAGYRTSLVMGIPYHAVQYAVYEAARNFIVTRANVPEDQFSVGSHCAAGGIAGASASAVTTPLDVVKTRLQTQGEVGARRYRNMVHALRTIYLEEGTAGLFRGVQPRVVFYTPAAAICWTTYELSKHCLRMYSTTPRSSEEPLSVSST